SFDKATVAAPITSGVDPNSLDSQTRSREPPTDTRTRCRTVCCSMLSRGCSGSGSAADGLVAQVATQVFSTGAEGAPGAAEATVSPIAMKMSQHDRHRPELNMRFRSMSSAQPGSNVA